MTFRPLRRALPLAVIAAALAAPLAWAQRADIGVTNIGPAAITAGANVTYTVTVTNDGPRAATVSLTDAVVAPLTFVSVTQTTGPTFTCSTPAVGATGEITCSIASLPVGALPTFSFVLRVAPSAAGGDRVSNTASITTSASDSNLSNNTSTTTASVATSADVSVTQTGPASVLAGTDLTYTLVVTNAGPADAATVSLTDTVPSGTTFVSTTQTTGPTFTCSTPEVGGTGPITCTIVALREGASATFSLVLRVSTTTTGPITTTANVGTTTSDPVPGNNSTSGSTPVTASITDVGLTKTASAPVAGKVTYTIVVTNHGPAVATNVIVTDVLAAGSMLSAAAMTQGSCTETATVTCALGTLSPKSSATIVLVVTPTSSGGLVSNTATVAAANDDPNPDNNSSTADGAQPAKISTLLPAALALLGIALVVVGFFVLRRRPAAIGRALFLAGIFLMVTGDWPQSTILPTRGVVPLQCPGWAWPSLYLVLLGASFVWLMSTGVLRVTRPTTSDFLYPSIVLLIATFLLSVVFSQVPSLSWWAFGCLLAIVGFTLAVARIVEDETSLARLSIVIAAAAVFLAVRVLAWRFDEGVTNFPYQIRNTAWLGKNQIAWILNLLAPLLLARFLAAHAIWPTLGYGGAWFLAGAAVYMVFSSTGVVALALTTLTLCALNAHYWRRWLILLTGFVGLGLGLMAASPMPSTRLIASLIHPERAGSIVFRQDVWRDTVRMIVDHPIIGIGLGTYDDVAYSQYRARSIEPWFFGRGWHAHNTHLHLLAETGAVGFLAWCLFWSTIVRFLLQRWRHGDRLGRLNSSGVLCVLLAFFVLSMTDAIVMARVHASLRMNLTLALLLIYGIRLAAPGRSAPSTSPTAT